MKNMILILTLVITQTGALTAFAEEVKNESLFKKSIKSVGGAVAAATVGIAPALAYAAAAKTAAQKDMLTVFGFTGILATACATASGAIIQIPNSGKIAESRNWLAEHRMLGSAIGMAASLAATGSIIVTQKINGALAVVAPCALGAVSGAAISGATLGKKVEMVGPVILKKEAQPDSMFAK